MSLSAIQSKALHDDDRADLRRSGLSDKTIESMGCSSGEADTIRNLTGVEKVNGPGYYIHYEGVVDQTGKPYLRWRLRRPIEKMRYVSGHGDDAQLYVPPAFRDLPKADLLVVTEGEKKAAMRYRRVFNAWRFRVCGAGVMLAPAQSRRRMETVPARRRGPYRP